MKHHTRGFAAGLVMAIALLVAACGDEHTVASKSAAAFREAQKTGTPVGGDRHGGHSAGAADHGATTSGDHATMTGMDHSTMTGMDHTTMAPGGQGDMAGMDHSKMNMGGQTGTAGMDHSSMPGMKPGQSMAGMDHSKMQQAQSMAGMDHSRMQGQPAGMDQATMQGRSTAGMDHSNMPGMKPGATTGGGAVMNAPTTSSEMQRLRPAATLRADAFDTPVPISVSEATKATQGGGHEGHEMRGITPGEDEENPPTPAPAMRDRSERGIAATPAMDHSQHEQGTPATGGASAPPPTMDHSKHAPTAPSPRARTTATPKAKAAAATVYTCPMHPEVTSGKPGSCPKCGMALVKKK